MWKKENDVGTQPMPTMATYSEAMDKFTKSATAFMEHVHHLTQARDAYQEAMSARRYAIAWTRATKPCDPFCSSWSRRSTSTWASPRSTRKDQNQ